MQILVSVAKAIVKPYNVDRKVCEVRRAILIKEVTSSVTKNFVISGQKQVEIFADAIETSANGRTPRRR